MPSDATGDGGILAGLRVVEGSAFVAAPSGGMHLANLGADVIRFDQIGGGIDYGRWPLAESGASLYWASLNRGKRSIAADLRSDAGRELLQALITAPGADAGMFLSNFPNRGWMAFDSLKERRPDLIMVSIMGNPDGSTALDYTVNAAVGYPALTGHDAGNRPTNHVLPAWDFLCGQQAVVGLLAAERHRSRTGDGQLVTISLADVAFATVANMGQIAEARHNQTQRDRLGNDLYGAFGRDFPTADGRRVIAVAVSKRQWTSLIDAVGASDAIALMAETSGDDFTDEGNWFKHREAIGQLVEAWTSARTLAQVRAEFDELGVCWGPYQDVLQMVADDPRCSVENALFAEVDQPGIGSMLAPGSPLSFGSHERTHAPAPRLGEHTEEVLAEVLGLAAAEIGALHDEGIVASP